MIAGGGFRGGTGLSDRAAFKEQWSFIFWGRRKVFRMDEKLSEVVRPQNIPLFPELCACVFVCVCVWCRPCCLPCRSRFSLSISSMGISSPLDSHLFKGKDCGSHYFCHPNSTKDKNCVICEWILSCSLLMFFSDYPGKSLGSIKCQALFTSWELGMPLKIICIDLVHLASVDLVGIRWGGKLNLQLKIRITWWKERILKETKTVSLPLF